MLSELRNQLAALRETNVSMGRTVQDGAVEAAVEVALDELLRDQTNVQALALARLMRDRRSSAVMIDRHASDLPEGYWLVGFTNPDFACGIAPDGSVSS